MLHQDLGLGARNQCAAIHLEHRLHEACFAENVLYGLAVGCSFDSPPHRGQLLLGEHLIVFEVEFEPFTAQELAQQQFTHQPWILDSFLLEELGAGLEHIFDGLGGV